MSCLESETGRGSRRSGRWYQFLFLSLFVFRFYKNHFITILFLFFFFFHENYFISSCSGMLRNVPECSVFRVLSTRSLTVALLRSVHAWVARRWSSLSCVRLDFPLLGNFYVRTCVKFTLANKIEALYEKSHVSVKVEPRSTSRLLSTLYILPLFYLLYLIKIFVR